MSEVYVSQDGYKPMVLPQRGEDLLEGRQYVLTPLARMILKEVYGLSNVPTIVECVQRKIAATVILTRTINLETRQVKKSRLELPPQAALFRAYIQNSRHIRFELDLLKMDELAEYYDKSHALPGQDPERAARTMRDMEQAWFDERQLPPLHQKFRGCTLRWWSKGAQVNVGSSIAPFMRRKSKPDLTLLDL